MKKLLQLFSLVFLGMALFACQSVEKTGHPAIQELEVPNQSGGMPNLHLTPSGEILLSWIEYLNDTTDALLFSKLENEGWSQPKTIATGSNWFVNWADFPSIAAYAGNENYLAAHWLQKSAAGKFDYDVRIAQSSDGGKTWGASFLVHTDGIEAEHGFATLVPMPEGQMFATWLDGRHTKTSTRDSTNTAGSHNHTPRGAMTLRAAFFDIDGKLTDEFELDRRVCECCQTSAALTSKGLIVAYRNRSDEEYRDIYFVRQLDTKLWTPPEPVFEDKWVITACPVNGPAIAAFGDKVALAWFTMAGAKPMVKVAFSSDAGEKFGLPVLVSNEKPEGRVDVIFLSKNKILVSWLENVNGEGYIKAVEFSSEGKKSEPFTVAATSLARLSGFPRMERAGDKVIFAWTEVKGNDETRVRSAMMRLEDL